VATHDDISVSEKLSNGEGLTRILADYAVHAEFTDLPDEVRRQSIRGFMNWMGCALGGSREGAVQIAKEVALETGAKPVASIIGHAERTDVASAAFINSMSSSILAFDDAHLPSLAHPTGPVSAALLALSEARCVSGEDFITAYSLGVEIICRLSNALIHEPLTLNGSFYINGLTAPIGVAAAVGRILKLDARRMRWALGLAASQGSGFRAVHGTMNSHFRPAHATRAGVNAALLAAKGFDSSDDSLEADKGFFEVYSPGSEPAIAAGELGACFEGLNVTFKPYPCGLVTHSIIDACFDIRKKLPSYESISKICVRANPIAFKLNGKRKPTTELECHISLYHWVAVTLLRGRAGLTETRQTCFNDPQVVTLRDRVEGISDPLMRQQEAVVEITCHDGTVLHCRVVEPRGSLGRPMTDSELDAKFFDQAGLVISQETAEALWRACSRLACLQDVGREVMAVLPGSLGH